MKTPFTVGLLALLVAAAGVGGWFLGRSSNRFELVQVGPAGSWVARIDRSTGAVALYDRTKQQWLAVGEPNYFDKFDADAYLASRK